MNIFLCATMCYFCIYTLLCLSTDNNNFAKCNFIFFGYTINSRIYKFNWVDELLMGIAGIVVFPANPIKKKSFIHFPHYINETQ